MNNEFGVSVPSESLPKSFESFKGNLLAIDQESSRIFWVTQKGVQFCLLKGLYNMKGKVDGELLNLPEDVTNVLIQNGWLVVSTMGALYLYELKNIQEKVLS